MEAPDLTLTISNFFYSAQRCHSNELGKSDTNLFLNHLKRLFEKTNNGKLFLSGNSMHSSKRVGQFEQFIGNIHSVDRGIQ